MGRSELREHIFRVLFRIEFNKIEEMLEQTEMYLDELEKISDKDREFVTTRSQAIIEKLPEIDVALNEHTAGWKTSRMNKADLAILRLAVYELTYDEDVPDGVAINEAVELGKKYSSEDGPSFINGVLAKFVKK